MTSGRSEKEMAELERMVSQKVQSLHERVKAKEDAFRVRPLCQAQKGC